MVYKYTLGRAAVKWARVMPPVTVTILRDYGYRAVSLILDRS